jgi:hypothetical protein
MKRTSNWCGIEALEQRIAPAVLIGTVGHKLVIKGDNLGDTITIDGVVGHPGNFTVTAGSTVSHVTGITDMAIMLGNGSDSLNFSNSVQAVDITGSLTITSTGGGKTLSAYDLTVGKNLSITYANAPGVQQSNTLVDPTIGGSVTIHNGNSSGDNYFYRDAAGNSTIHGNVTIANGAGYNETTIEDINVGGNVTVTNGPAPTSGVHSGYAGYVEIYNYYNNSALSIIRGNVSVSYKTGVVDYDGIWDTEVLGNVTFNHGSGSTTTDFDGYVTTLPDIFRKDLTITGTGPAVVTVGTQYQGTGLQLQGALKITSGGNDYLNFEKLDVGGTTTLTDGKGTNTTTINDSVFVGAFKFADATGTDTISIDTGSGTTLPTVFEQAAAITMGKGGSGSVTFGGSSAGEVVDAYSTISVVLLGGGATENFDVVFPFGGSVVSI